MAFADTGGWFAAFVPNDPDHPAASPWLKANRAPLLTTDWVVVDERLTLLRVRGEGQRASRLGEALFGEQIAEAPLGDPGRGSRRLVGLPPIRRQALDLPALRLSASHDLTPMGKAGTIWAPRRPRLPSNIERQNPQRSVN